jgi:hypothetical protein
MNVRIQGLAGFVRKGLAGWAVKDVADRKFLHLVCFFFFSSVFSLYNFYSVVFPPPSPLSYL